MTRDDVIIATHAKRLISVLRKKTNLPLFAYLRGIPVKELTHKEFFAYAHWLLSRTPGKYHYVIYAKVRSEMYQELVDWDYDQQIREDVHDPSTQNSITYAERLEEVFSSQEHRKKLLETFYRIHPTDSQNFADNVPVYYKWLLDMVPRDIRAIVDQIFEEDGLKTWKARPAA